MSQLPPLFMTSGDLIADRRVELARQYQSVGDLAAAADLFAQAVERAPQFAWAWFMLGEAREKLGDTAGAVEAFLQARENDSLDRLGAGLRLARFGAADPTLAMSDGYVRALFDQYAPTFETALSALSYNAPQQLFDAVTAACDVTGREAYFDKMLDLGCGTGLAAREFAKCVDSMNGVDLSPKMIEMAEGSGLYSFLSVDDMLGYMRRQGGNGADLIVAADALVYLSDLAPLFREVFRVLEFGGLFAFTVETHAGQGAVLGEKLRYAHGADYVRATLREATLHEVSFARVSTRMESGQPVPGLLVVAEQRDRLPPPLE
jgi:predicted TPR repeat methyltransferase